jgi:hypothetical protein
VGLQPGSTPPPWVRRCVTEYYKSCTVNFNQMLILQFIFNYAVGNSHYIA